MQTFKKTVCFILKHLTFFKISIHCLTIEKFMILLCFFNTIRFFNTILQKIGFNKS